MPLDATSNKGRPQLLPENNQLRPALPRLPRLPDLLTTANLCCGVASILSASQGGITFACWLVFIAALFDVFDGLAARALGGGSELGKQLDSLADMVSFGVAPGIIAFRLASAAPLASLVPAWTLLLWIPVASAWRLAKFNIDTRQAHGFLGLPTPANALFWAALGTAIGHAPLDPSRYPLVLLAIGIVLGLLMLSELPLPSLKFKHKGWKGNEVVITLALAGVVLVAAFGFLAVPLLVILYLLSPLWGKLFPKPV